jgi:3-hydroxybutyrate dehydrogenase
MAGVGRVALVTGGGRGIGRAIAVELGGAGLAVIVGARTRMQIDETVALVRGAGGTAVAVELDVTDAVSVGRAVGRAVAEAGAVDVLVNNAGIAESAVFSRTDLEMWDRHLRVNATGPYLVTRAILPGMLERGWGRVVNVASTAGLAGAPYVSAYTASKHALVGLTRALAAEVAGRGVTVNAVCPGFAATDIVWNGARSIAARSGRAFSEAVESLARLNPGGRLIEPQEIADAVRRLIDDDTRNGETVVLDGTAPAGRTP